MLSDSWHVGAFDEKQALYDLVATYRELVYQYALLPGSDDIVRRAGRGRNRRHRLRIEQKVNFVITNVLDSSLGRD